MPNEQKNKKTAKANKPPATQEATEAKTPHPGGAPTKYDPSMCDAVIELGRSGKSITQIAVALDVTRETVYAWCKTHQKFSDAISRAKELAQAWWEDVGQQGLFADKFQASLWSKQVSCRFPNDYREKSDINVAVTAFGDVLKEAEALVDGGRNDA